MKGCYGAVVAVMICTNLAHLVLVLITVNIGGLIWNGASWLLIFILVVIGSTLGAFSEPEEEDPEEDPEDDTRRRWAAIRTLKKPHKEEQDTENGDD